MQVFQKLPSLYKAVYFDRRINIWDWLVPIEQPIQIRGYSSREAEAESVALAERRTFDERYRVVGQQFI